MLKYNVFIMAVVACVCACTSAPKSTYDRHTDPLVIDRDTTINPADNFFAYAHGTWFKSNPIPASESSNGIFKMVQDSVNKAVRSICEKSAANKNAAPGSAEQKIGDFYYSGMDTISIEKAGLAPLYGELKNIDAVKDINSMLASIAHLQALGCGPLFNFYITRDDKNSSKYQCFVWQGGIGLPERDYYFNTDDNTKNIRVEYVKHIAKMFDLLNGKKDNAAVADKIMALETALAKASRKMEDLRDPYANYNKRAIGEVSKLTPALDWKDMMGMLGVKTADTIILGQPEFLTAVNNLLKTVSVEDWKNYLRWNLINTYAAFLNKDIDDENFHFYGAILTGTKQQQPRWKRVVEHTNAALGELIGQVYVKDYLPQNTKQKLTEIGTNIMAVYREHLQNVDWMSAETKKKALVKLSKVTMKLGYPDKWKDYSALAIDRKSYVINCMRANEWQYNYMINHYGKPVDRTEWDMYPQTYNAYYQPTNNEIVIPACNIIVPGYSGLPDDAVLYGVIGGSTFGHEITHGFDDQGRLYDAYGNLHNWWTKEDSAKFSAKTKLLVKQFDGYTVLGGKYHVNGKASIGENIADLGGVIMGYEAFKKTDQYKKGEKLGGFTPDQRYFLAYTYSWMVQQRDEQLAQRIMSDVHSPAEYRVIGPLSNIDAFYKAFNVLPTSKMYRADSVRVVIW